MPKRKKDNRRKRRNVLSQQKTPLRKSPDASSDPAARQILGTPDLLALILHHARPDIFSLPVLELADHLKKEDIIYSDELANGLRSNLTEPEKNIPGQGSIIYDSLNIYTSPDDRSCLVNVEVMKSFHDAVKKLAGRIIYYNSQAFSSQKNDRSGFKGTEYENLRPVYALWIFPSSNFSFTLPFGISLKPQADQPDQKLLRNLVSNIEKMLIFDLVGISEKWIYSDSELYRCLGHIFRAEKTMDERTAYLRKEGLSVEKLSRPVHQSPNTEMTLYDVLKVYGERNSMESQRNQYKEENDLYREENDRYKKENNRYKEENSRYKEENNRYKKENSRYKKKHERDQSSLREAAEKIKQLEFLLNSRNQKEDD